MLCAPVPAWAQGELAWRTGYIECGQTQVRARAQCYAGTSRCVSETLSFTRPGGRAIVGLHPHAPAQPREGGNVRALDYHASAWSCAPGKPDGRYIAVVMAHSAGSECAECRYVRLYDLNGRLVAAELAFDAAGAARRDDRGRALIGTLLVVPEARGYRPVYR